MGLLIFLFLFATSAWSAQVQIIGSKALQPEVIRQRILAKIGQGQAEPRQLEQLKFQILELYHKAGFINANLEWVISSPKKLICKIDEGNQVIVRHIRVTGVQHFSEELLRSKIWEFVKKEPFGPTYWNYDYLEIDSILNPSRKNSKKADWVFFEQGFVPFNKSLFQQAKDALEEFYLDNGFLEVRIFGPKQSDIFLNHWVDLQFRIEEGEQTRVSEIQFVGAEPELKNPAIKIGDPLNLNLVEEDRIQLEEFFWNQGYPHAEINAPVDGSKIVYQINLGERVRIENMIISGNVVTKKWVIQNRIKLQPGDWYSLEKLTESRSQILQTDLFSEVDLSLQGNNLLVKVKERERNTLEIGFGASLVDGPRVTGIWQYRNILGSGISFRTRTQLNYPAVFYNLPLFYPDQVSEALKKQTSNYFEGRASAGFLYPRMPGLPFNLDSSIDFAVARELRPAYILNTASSVLSLLSQVTQNLRITPQLELEYDEFDCPTCVQGNPSVPVQLDQGIVKQITPKLLLLWDKRDNALLPKKGYAIELNTDFGFGAFETQTITYTKILAGLTTYLPLMNHLTWVLNTKAGGIWNLGNGNYTPLFKRFYLGGTTSVRGFPDNQVFPVDATKDTLVSLGGSYVVFVRNEIRFPIAGALEGGIFADTGELMENIQNFGFSKLALGTGFGIRYDTPIGPLMLDLGLRVFDGDRNSGMDFVNRFCLHFSIGNAI